MAEQWPGRIDLARVTVVVLFTLSTLSAVAKAWVTATSRLPVHQAVPELVSSVLTAAFCVLVVTAYLRRGQASATDGSPGVRLAAPLATCLPLVIPVLPAGPDLDPLRDRVVALGDPPPLDVPERGPAGAPARRHRAVSPGASSALSG
jgi:hypothetical protein